MFKSCPFCGSNKVIHWQSMVDNRLVHCVFCESCEAEGPHDLDKDSSIARWNQRVKE